MSTVFSGGTYVNNASIDGSSKTNLIYAGASGNNIQSALTTAGWTVVSGSGTTNLLMQTAQDPTTLNRGRVRFKDNGGSCVQVSIENVSGSKAGTNSTNGGACLLCSAGKVYCILASKYRFEIFTLAVTQPREFACAGTIWIPAPYQGVITEAIYMGGNVQNDGDTTNCPCFRNNWGCGGLNGAISPNYASIINGTMVENVNTGNAGSGCLQLRVPGSANVGNYRGSGPSGFQNAYRWHDNALDQADALIAWPTTSVFTEAFIRGQMYDWTILSDTFSVDSTDSWNDGGSSHNFYCLLSQAGDASTAHGSIWVAYS